MAKAPYLQVFNMDGVLTTSVVMDREDFDALLLDIAKVPIPPADVDAMSRAGMIPLMRRGTGTETFFVRYGVTTDHAGFVVRGVAKELLKKIQTVAKEQIESN